MSDTVIFNGREFSEKILTDIKRDVTDIAEILGRKPKLVTIYNPNDEASRVYTEIKAKKAVELEVEFEKFSIFNFQFSINDLIIKFNNDKNIDGVMIQMPLGTENDKFLIDLIDLKKDVDGLNSESGVVPATVRAVMEILEYSLNNTPHPPLSLRGGAGGGDILVIGNKGLVGEAIQRFMKYDMRFKKYEISGMDKEDFRPGRLKHADIIISATGMASLIHGYMVKDGVIAIDVGYPKGDFDPDVADKASFFTPVPGGVGPVTVVMLFANLMDLVYKNSTD